MGGPALTITYRFGEGPHRARKTDRISLYVTVPSSQLTSNVMAAVE